MINTFNKAKSEKLCLKIQVNGSKNCMLSVYQRRIAEKVIIW